VQHNPVASSSMQTTSIQAQILASNPSDTQRPTTRLHHGITKPKTYTDGTIRYNGKFGFLALLGEPHNLSEALHDNNWKSDMDQNFLSCRKIKRGISYLHRRAKT
jgi:hypothetical protein